MHPMRLIMYLAMCESIYQIMLLLSERICQFRLNELLAWTLYFGASNYDVSRTTVLLAKSCNFLSLAFLSMSMSLNMCLCVDLVLMVRFPFDKKENRVPWYLSYSILLAIVVAVLNLNWNGKDYQGDALYIGGCIQIAQAVLSILTFIISVIYTFRKLSGPSMSKQVRNLVLKRHVVTMLVYFLCNIYVFVSFFLVVIKKWNNSGDISDAWYVLVFKILFASQGLLIPLMRLSEPFFYRIVLQKTKKWWNRNTKVMKTKQAQIDSKFVHDAYYFSS